MLGLAYRAIAAPAGLREHGGRAAIGTEAMARVPAEDRLGFGKRRQVHGVNLALHGDGAQIDELEVAARLERVGRSRIDADAEARRYISIGAPAFT